ncbi:unnamed protein product, partial [Symbiodinium sp. KB8]
MQTCHIESVRQKVAEPDLGNILSDFAGIDACAHEVTTRSASLLVKLKWPTKTFGVFPRAPSEVGEGKSQNNSFAHSAMTVLD